MKRLVSMLTKAPPERHVQVSQPKGFTCKNSKFHTCMINGYWTRLNQKMWCGHLAISSATFYTKTKEGKTIADIVDELLEYRYDLFDHNSYKLPIRQKRY